MRPIFAALTVVMAAAALAGPAAAQRYEGPPEDAPFGPNNLLGVDGRPPPVMVDPPRIMAVCSIGITSSQTIYYSLPFMIQASDKGEKGFLPVQQPFWDYVIKTYHVDLKDRGFFGCDSYRSVEEVGDLEDSMRAMFLNDRFVNNVETTYLPPEPGRRVEGYDPNNKPVREREEEENPAAF